LTFIYRYHHYEAPKERRHETLDAAIEDAAGALERGDAFPHEIVSDTGDVILNQKDLLLRIGFSERWIWISNFKPMNAKRRRRTRLSSEDRGRLTPATDPDRPSA
jgi:hypothetical protein